MSFSASLRAPIRRAASKASAVPKAQFRSSYRRFSTPSTPPPAAKSNTGLFAGVGAVVAVGGLAYYFYGSDAGREAATAVKSGVQGVKAKTNFTPSQADYQKVVAHSLCAVFGSSF